MGIAASALIEWLSQLDPDQTVGIGDSGTTLEVEGHPDWIEVGMVPPDDPPTEGVHGTCSKCGGYGHWQDDCPSR